MSGPEPRVSIVVAVRDGAGTIRRCLESVWEQSHPERELIVIDGGSTDGTREILENCSPRIDSWESRPDRGICHAWNKALDRMSGEWVCFLGADDRLSGPDVLGSMAAALLRAGSTHRVVYAGVHVVDAAGGVRATVGRPWSEVRADFAHRMAIPHQATFHHRSLFARHGRFDESFRICGDYEFLLRELTVNDALFVPGLIVTEMGAGGISDSPDSGWTMTREFERARRMHGLSRMPPWLSPRLWRAGLRLGLTRTLGRRAADSAASVYRLLVGRPRP